MAVHLLRVHVRDRARAADLYALFFSLLAVWLLLRRPQVSPWWPSLALALAVNIKAYPGVLAVVLLWRYRWRAVVPLLVTNLALLLCAGPGNVRQFLVSRARLESSTSSRGWVNHSSWSLAHTLHLVSSWPGSLWLVFLAASAVVWIATLVVVIRCGWSARRAVLVSAACVPVMCTFPSISNDYRLVLLVFPLSVLAAVTAARRRDGGPLWALLFMAVGSEFFLLARSSRLVAPSLQGSKFALIVGLQVLLLIVGALEGRVRKTVCPGEVARAQATLSSSFAKDPTPAYPRQQVRRLLVTDVRGVEPRPTPTTRCSGSPPPSHSASRWPPPLVMRSQAASSAGVRPSGFSRPMQI